jgi:hypothetical protein
LENNFYDSISKKVIPEIQEKNEKKRRHLIQAIDSLVSNNFNDINQIPILLDEMFYDPFFDANKDLFYKLLNHLETSSLQMIKICNSYKEAITKQEHVVNIASELAKKIHCGQVDKSGKDYYKGHLMFVAQMGSNWRDKIVGYLHDATEDKNYSTDNIIKVLKNESNEQLLDADAKVIKDALDLLNSRTSSSRKEYIERLKNNGIAMRVKLNDLYHNMDLSRIENPTQIDIDRVKKYQKEYSEILTCVIPYL